MRPQREASEDHGGDAESIKYAAYSAADFQGKTGKGGEKAGRTNGADKKQERGS